MFQALLCHLLEGRLYSLRRAERGYWRTTTKQVGPNYLILGWPNYPTSWSTQYDTRPLFDRSPLGGTGPISILAPLLIHPTLYFSTQASCIHALYPPSSRHPKIYLAFLILGSTSSTPSSHLFNLLLQLPNGSCFQPCAHLVILFQYSPRSCCCYLDCYS